MESIKKCIREYRRILVGLGMVILTPLWITSCATDAFATDPSLYLQCENNMRSVTGQNPMSSTGITYGASQSGLGQAAEFPAWYEGGASVVFDSSGVWNRSQGTFAVWIKPRFDYSIDSQRHDIFSVDVNFSFTLIWNGALSSSPDAPGLHFATNPTEQVNVFDMVSASSSLFRDNAWHHVACSWGAQGKKLYVDGVLKSFGSYSPVYQAIGPIYIGMSSHHGEQELFHVNAWMDEIRFYLTQLPDSEVQNLFSGAATTAYGSITGRVTSASDGAGLVGVLVTANPGNHTATTASGGISTPSGGGAYTLSVPAGTYEVRFFASGYRTVCYNNVVVPQDQTVTINAQLTAGTGEASCTAYTGGTDGTTGNMCAAGNPLYFYFIQKNDDSTMTALSITNPCPTASADPITVRYYIGEATGEMTYRPLIPLPAAGHILRLAEDFTNRPGDAEGWMSVESARTTLVGAESICDIASLRTALALPSFIPRDRWTLFYFTSLPGWTTKVSIFNPNNSEVTGISIKAYNNSGTLVGTSSVNSLRARSQVFQRAQDLFPVSSIGDGWIEIHSPNGQILAFGYLTGP